MRIRDLTAAMEQIAPTRYAEAWDNVGLLAGDPDQPLTRAMLTIDYTAEVADETAAARCDAVVAYHPPLFQPLKRLVAGQPVFDAIRRGIALYSPHTALDVADGSTNDMLADVLGLADRAPLRLASQSPQQYKLVVFVPESNAEAVAQAIFDAGAGRIGEYSSCSFRTPGTGTFFGESGTNPAVGQQGQLERVAELRLETVVPIARAGAVVKALLQAHPYEQPAFDLVQLAAPPESKGMGRIGSIEPAADRADLIERIKRGLGVNHLLIAGPTRGPAARAAVGAGACGDLLNDALAQKADLYLTGEMRHHDAVKAAAAGMTVICALHSNSERPILPRLAEQLRKRLPDLPITISQRDRDPFAIG